MAEIGWTEKTAQDWKRYKPPSRPAKSEVKIYDSVFAAKKGCSVLILGSTPELRELAAKYEMKVTIVDWSEDICKALKLLMKHKNAREAFSKQDWLQMKFDEKFDMVVGDCATTVVPYAELENVLRNISNCLKPDGIAVQRIWVRYNNVQTPDLPYVRKLFESKPEHIHWYTWMLFPVFVHYYDSTNERLAGDELYQKMLADYEKGGLPKALVDLFSLVKNHKTPNNVPEKAHLESILEKYFSIVKTRWNRDCFSRNAPIYVLKARRPS